MEEADTGLPPLLPGFRHDTHLAHAIYGIVSPFFIFITVINNIFLVVILYIDSKKRSPSCIQHACIAILNGMTGLIQLPVFLSAFRSRNNPAWDAHWLCFLYRICGYVIPHLFQALLNWTFLALALQRYLCFKFPFKAVVWYKNDKIVKLTVLACAIPFTTVLVRLFDFRISLFSNSNIQSGTSHSTNASYFSIVTAQFQTTENTPVLGCRVHFVFGEEHERNYHVASLVLNNVLPLVSLFLLQGFLLQAILANNSRRMRLTRNSTMALRAARLKTMKESSVLLLVFVFILASIPKLIVKCVMVAKYLHFDATQSQQPEIDVDNVIICHFLQLLSYSWYILIYTVMNHEFRSTGRRLFVKLCRRNRHDELEMTAL